MTEVELLKRMPLAEYISVTSAAEILGGGRDRVQELLHLIGIGNIPCRSHAPTAGSTRAIPGLGIVRAMPLLESDTDPDTVFIESNDVLWRWCVDVEAALHSYPDGPPKEVVEIRFCNLKKRSVEQLLDSSQSPAHQTATLAPRYAVGIPYEAPEPKEQRQDRRLQACIDAGLPMDTRRALLRLPDGVGRVADDEGVSRQAFSADVKAALQRHENARREGTTAGRAC